MQAFKLGSLEEKGISEGIAVCQNPLCDAEFEQTGIARLEPRRFCSPKCQVTGMDTSQGGRDASWATA
jgi:hypothetical protein